MAARQRLYMHQLAPLPSASVPSPLELAAAEYTAPSTGAVVSLPSLTCRRCNHTFDTVAQLRAHFKAEHSYGGAGAGAEVDSGGSDDSSSDEEAWEALQREEAAAAGGAGGGAGDEDEDDYQVEAGTRRSGRGGAATTGSPHVPVYLTDQDETYSVWKVVLEPAVLEQEHLPLRAVSADLAAPGELWLSLLYGGGYMAAVVARITPRLDSEEDAAIRTWPHVLLHKRFARYTTRRKQGGSQMAHDAAAGRAAKSMGAQLRRHNEAQLIKDIHVLLGSAEWLPSVRTCRRVFIAAAKTVTWHLFDGVALSKGDPRIRRVPFMTHRPSYAEAVRVIETLARIERYEGPVPGTVAAAVAATAAATAAVPAAAVTVAPAPSVPVTLRNEPPAVSEAQLQEAEADGEEEAEEQADGAAADGGSGGGGGPRRRQRHRGNKKKKKAKQQRAAAATADDKADDDGANEGDGDDDGEEAELLAAAVSEAAAAKRVAAVTAAEKALTAQLLAEVGTEARRLGAVLRVPPFVLTRMLGVEAQVDAASRGDTTQPLDAGAVEEVREQMALLASLADMGAAAPEAFSALGWDSLSAAALVSASGLFVDWSQVQRDAPQPHMVKLKKTGKSTDSAKADAEGDSPSILRGYTKSKSKSSGGGSSGGGSKSSADARAAAAPAPAPQPAAAAPVATPPGMAGSRLSAADEAALAGLSERERKRLLASRAAEARMARAGVSGASGGGAAE